MENIPDTMDDEGVEQLDLAHTRDLLTLLAEFNVAAFQCPGFAVTFHEPDEGFVATPSKQQTEDDGHSTSNKRVEGLAPRRDGFRHPSLYPGQNGKVLRFDGTLE